MKPILLTDFGSTYTKLTAVDAEQPKLLATAAAFTTIDTDVSVGFQNALQTLRQKLGDVSFSEAYACSSAAGGLRMMVSGLVPELTSEAARLASLGAGAKVIGNFSFELTDDDLQTIRAEKPDIFLLVGGTDGGNAACITHNAEMLASIKPDFPIIYAGNRAAASTCKKLLEGCELTVCPNVMPKFGVLKIEQTQASIREIFLRRIIEAKGLSKTASMFSDILMPTPAAVLKAMTLLSDGVSGIPGIGELIGVDVGGATTDVYSIADGMPQQMNRVYKGLPEPYAKRTVEGDIGMRYSLRGVVDAAGISRVCRLSGLCEQRVNELLTQLQTDKSTVGHDDDLARFDFAVACLATEIGVTRHAGTIEETYTMMGQTFVQSGKDLGSVKNIIITGGSLIHSDRAFEIAAHAQFDPMQPGSLRPKKARVAVDRSYILAAMGLLSAHYPEAALTIMKKELEWDGNSEP